LYTAPPEAGIAIEAVAALARHKLLNMAQEYARRADQLRSFEEPGAIDMRKGGRRAGASYEADRVAALSSTGRKSANSDA
jgi:hypothetical protein